MFDMSIAEIAEEIKQESRERYERGLVRYSPEDQTFWFADRRRREDYVYPESGIKGNYYIPLRVDVRTPAGFVQVLARLREKKWFSRQMMDDFWEEFEVVARMHGYSVHQLPDQMTWGEPS